MNAPLTFEAFVATRQWSDDLRPIYPDQFENYPSDHSPPRGWYYLNGPVFIEEVQEWWPQNARDEGRWYLVIGNMERVTDDLDSLERELHEWSISAGYTADDAAQFLLATSICDKWVKRIGLGFHPDTRGPSYVEISSGVPFLTPDEAADYDTDMDKLFTLHGDPYGHGLAAMKRAGLT